jgi:hypothetical protein
MNDGNRHAGVSAGLAADGGSTWWALADAWWRALAYSLLPRVIWLSLLPLLASAVLLGGLAWWGWDAANVAVRGLLDSWAWSQWLTSWLDQVGLTALRTAVVPLLIVAISVPVVVIVCLLAVGAITAPAMSALVRQRRFPALQAREPTPWWRALLAALGLAAWALLALIVSLPLWLVPPLALVLPPLIWGWLTYRVMLLDVLADWATDEERAILRAHHRGPLLAMGVACGLFGAAPGALWAIGGVMALAMAPLLLLASVWIYTLVFALAALWFAHYLLAALDALRRAPVNMEHEA